VLGLATPTAVVVGVGRAVELGIVIKNIEVMEMMPKLTSVASRRLEHPLRVS